MNRILLHILLLLIVSFQPCAQPPTTANSQTRVPIKIQQNTHGKPKVPHAPICIDIEVIYDSNNQILEVSSDIEASANVYLYLDNCLIDTDDQINTSFSVSQSGTYTIEIISDSWTAEGSFTI